MWKIVSVLALYAVGWTNLMSGPRRCSCHAATGNIQPVLLPGVLAVNHVRGRGFKEIVLYVPQASDTKQCSDQRR